MTTTDLLARYYMPLPLHDLATGDILDSELVYGPGLEPHQVTVLLPGQPPMLVPHADLAAGLTRTVRIEAGAVRLTVFPQAGDKSVLWELSTPAAAEAGGRVTVLLVKVGVAWLLPYLAACGEVAPDGVDLPVVDWDVAAVEFFGEGP